MTVMPIEAKSLSSLTALASNPPSYPRNPTHEKHEPLILYIARVPGSRDVFLSPMKPRERVVTAEDIQTSLYFVHVNSPEDAQIIHNAQSFQEPETGQATKAQGPLPSIQRKAVPHTAAAAPPRKPVPGILAPASGFESRQNVAAFNYATPDSNYLSPNTQRLSFDSTQRRAANDRPPPSPRGHSEEAYSQGTSLTVIRRDPSSGAQWNVAHIKDSPTLEVSSVALDSIPTKRSPGAPMYIDITNPGYSKFIHYGGQNNPQLPSRDAELSASSTSAYSLEGDPPRYSEEREMDRPKMFHRRLWMEGAKDPSGGFGHRRFQSHDSNMSTGSPRSNVGELQHFSMDTRPSHLSRENQTYSTIQVSERSTSFRGYVFMSPWNGRCEFTTGAGGGSLKCQHIVPGLQGKPPVSLPVSELRFNLPAAAKASSSRASTPRAEESKRSSFFRPRHSRQSSSVSDTRSDGTQDVRSSFERMDLSLGQEYAGGGFGGKESKLGKLIIEDEGMKMVDLLVAANVALWWRAYEKYETRIKTNRGSF